MSYSGFFLRNQADVLIPDFLSWSSIRAKLIRPLLSLEKVKTASAILPKNLFTAIG